MSACKKLPAGQSGNIYPKKHEGHGRITGPCGDTMEFWIAVSQDVIDQVSFTTTGCGSSAACGNMTASIAKGRAVREAAKLKQEDILEALGTLPPETEHCALLAVNTLKAAIEDYVRLRQESPKAVGQNEKKEDSR